MNDFQAIAKGRCEHGFVSGIDHAGQAINGVFRGGIWLFIWMLLSGANALRLLDEHTTNQPQQMSLDEVA